MSDMVKNPEDRFSHDAAYLIPYKGSIPSNLAPAVICPLILVIIGQTQLSALISSLLAYEQFSQFQVPEF